MSHIKVEIIKEWIRKHWAIFTWNGIPNSNLLKIDTSLFMWFVMYGFVWKIRGKLFGFLQDSRVEMANGCWITCRIWIFVLIFPIKSFVTSIHQRNPSCSILFSPPNTDNFPFFINISEFRKLTEVYNHNTALY